MNALMLLKYKDAVAYLLENDTLKDGLAKLMEHGYTAIPVLTEKGTYAGSVTEGDFLRHILKNYGQDLSKDIYIRDIIRKDFLPPVRVDVNMEQLLEMSMRQNFIPVIDDRDYFIGIVTRQDIIRAMIQ